MPAATAPADADGLRSATAANAVSKPDADAANVTPASVAGNDDGRATDDADGTWRIDGFYKTSRGSKRCLNLVSQEG